MSSNDTTPPTIGMIIVTNHDTTQELVKLLAARSGSQIVLVLDHDRDQLDQIREQFQKIQILDRNESFEDLVRKLREIPAIQRKEECHEEASITIDTPEPPPHRAHKRNTDQHPKPRRLIPGPDT